MFSLDQRITAFHKLGEFLSDYLKNQATNGLDNYAVKLDGVVKTAKNHNGWFTEDNVKHALQSWANSLTSENLANWTDAYTPAISNANDKRVGVVMAGNIPLVGFHDFLSVLISGYQFLGKTSSSDAKLLPLLANVLIQIEPEFANRIEFTKDKFIDFDAIIAIGSNNTARYFEHYFGKYPNIIRKNRHSVAVLTGEETPEQLTALGEDIFRYYGLGCRSVSKLYVPKGYDFDLFFGAIYEYKAIIDHDKYANNYDYNKAVYMMNDIPMLENGFLVLKEDEKEASPVSFLFYEYYSDMDGLGKRLTEKEEELQCVVATKPIVDFTVEPGKTQSPSLSDYADRVDTMAFLAELA